MECCSGRSRHVLIKVPLQYILLRHRRTCGWSPVRPCPMVGLAMSMHRETIELACAVDQPLDARGKCPLIVRRDVRFPVDLEHKRHAAGVIPGMTDTARLSVLRRSPRTAQFSISLAQIRHDSQWRARGEEAPWTTEGAAKGSLVSWVAPAAPPRGCLAVPGLGGRDGSGSGCGRPNDALGDKDSSRAAWRADSWLLKKNPRVVE